MTKMDVMEQALQERYEYLEALRFERERLDKNIRAIEKSVDDLLIRILKNYQD